MTLAEARIIFTKCLAQLVLFADGTGKPLAFGEGMDRKTTKDPTSDHMKGSLHDVGLGQDADRYEIIKDESGMIIKFSWLTRTEDHADLGAFWKTLHPFCKWGGDFGDGNHYSFSDRSIPGCLTSNGALKK